MPTEPQDVLTDIAPMTALDIERGMDLVRAAGWNQTREDWSMLLRVGRCFGLHTDNGRLVATSAILPYPPAFAWIGMVLVDPAWRRQGLASRLLDHAIGAIRADGLVPMLDATPAGRAVYQRMGFTDVAAISRWRGEARGTGPHEIFGVPQEPSLAHGIAADAAAFGANRGTILTDFFTRPGGLTLLDEDAVLWSRVGRTATQIGPLVSNDEAEGLRLCGRALDQIRGSVMLDVPDRETSMASALSERGFAVERSFTRMALGSPVPSTLSVGMRVIAGPELG